MTGRFEGKQALVLGVANQRSIAWAIAKRLADEGASVAFTYQGERIEKNVRDLAATVESPLVTECDVRSDDDLVRVFSEVSDTTFEVTNSANCVGLSLLAARSAGMSVF